MIARILLIAVVFFSIRCYAEDRISSYTDENGQTVYTNQKTTPQSESSEKIVPKSPFQRSYQGPIVEYHLPIQPSYNGQNETSGTRNQPNLSTTPGFPQYNKAVDKAFENEMNKAATSIGSFFGALILLGIIALVLWLVALIDILRSEFKGSNKIVWILVVSFFPILGIILYFFIGLNQKILPGVPQEFQ